MKCKRCGFIMNDEFDRCPYCGTVQDLKEENVLSQRISFGKQGSLKLSNLIIAVCMNLLFICIGIDAYFNFATYITLVGYTVFMGTILVLAFITRQYNRLRMTMGVFLFLFMLFVIIGLTFNIKININGELYQLKRYILGYGVPTLVIVCTVLVTIFLVKDHEKQFRPAVTDLFILLMLTIAIVNLVFFLNCESGENKAFEFLMTYNATEIFIQRILTYLALGLCSLLFVNYNVILVAAVMSKVKYVYGK